MKVKFKGITRDGSVVTSNSIIQKETGGVIYILLNIKGHWITISNESLEIELCKNKTQCKSNLS